MNLSIFINTTYFKELESKYTHNLSESWHTLLRIIMNKKGEVPVIVIL